MQVRIFGLVNHTHAAAAEAANNAVVRYCDFIAEAGRPETLDHRVRYIVSQFLRALVRARRLC